MAPLPGSPHAHFLAFSLPDSSSCEDRNCQNRQTCNYIRPGRYICTCSPGYYGSNCQYGACLDQPGMGTAVRGTGQQWANGCQGAVSAIGTAESGGQHAQSGRGAARGERLPAGLLDRAGTSSRIPRTEDIPAPEWSCPAQAPRSPQVGPACPAPASRSRARTQAAAWRRSGAMSVSARRATLDRTVETVSTNTGHFLVGCSISRGAFTLMSGRSSGPREPGQGSGIEQRVCHAEGGCASVSEGLRAAAHLSFPCEWQMARPLVCPSPQAGEVLGSSCFLSCRAL